MIVERERRPGQGKVRRGVLEPKAGLRLHLRDLLRQHGVAGVDALLVVERHGQRGARYELTARHVDERRGVVARSGTLRALETGFELGATAERSGIVRLEVPRVKSAVGLVELPRNGRRRGGIGLDDVAREVHVAAIAVVRVFDLSGELRRRRSALTTGGDRVVLRGIPERRLVELVELADHAAGAVEIRVVRRIGDAVATAEEEAIERHGIAIIEAILRPHRAAAGQWHIRSGQPRVHR